MTLISVCLFITLFLLVYPILLYPILLILISFFVKKEIKNDPNFTPRISIVVSLYNEEKNIYNLLDSIIQSGYPLDRIEILFGSDGSTDRTNHILKEISSKYFFVKSFFFERKGKSFVLNHLIKETNYPFILLLDADVRLTEGSVQKLTSYFTESSVGIATPSFVTKRKNQGKIPATNLNLIKLNNIIRSYESLIYSTVNLLGACYLIRRELFPTIPAEKFCDDFFTALFVNFSGKRVVLAKDAFVYLEQEISPLKSFYRQRRFAAGGLSAMMFFWKSFCKYPSITFFLFSGKFLRWLFPINLIIFFALLFFLNLSVFVKIIFALFVIFVTPALIDFILEKKGKQVLRILYVPAKVVFSLAGSFIGLFRSVGNKNNSLW